MHQLLHDLAVDVLTDLTETMQLNEEAGDDTYNAYGMSTRRLWEHIQVTYDSVSQLRLSVASS